MTPTTCGSCGATNPAIAVFCGHCGRPLLLPTEQSSVVCSACGWANQLGAAFCGNCGAPITTIVDDTITDAPAPDSPVTAVPSPKVPQGAVLSDELLHGGDLPPVVHVPATVSPTAKARGGSGWLLAVAALAGLLLLASAVAYFLLSQLGVVLPQELSNRELRETSLATEELAPQLTSDELDSATASISTSESEALTVTQDLSVVADLAPTLTPTQPPTTTDTIPPTATATALPTATATALPTATATALPTATAIPLPTATAIPLPTATAIIQSEACLPSPGPRWGSTLWARHRDRLGCATTNEIRSNAAYQYYQHGMMVWREVPDLVYVLYNDSTYAVFPAAGQDGYFVSDWVKGSFGYLWTNNEAVRTRVGQAEAAEFNATNFAAQDFAGGTIFYFLENEANNYVLFDDNRTWLSARQ